ncbi:MAG: geranylgeranylglyceryl/heptaprenylglyceryl phosphate synthase [Thermoplasmata archaeon]
MNVEDYIMKRLESEKIHMGLIDPEEQNPEVALEIALILEEVGSDAIMIGGSTGVEIEEVDKTVELIKEQVSLPVIIFPTNAETITPRADAIYFMSILNSRDRQKITGEQVKGAPIIRGIDLEPISLAYVVVEPGMTVGRVGDCELIPRDRPGLAISYGLAAQYLGMHFFYLEAGSGAPSPVPSEMVREVKSAIDIPLFIGGGIRTKEQALEVGRAGADIIVTGTVIEENKDIKQTLEGLISTIKEI